MATEDNATDQPLATSLAGFIFLGLLSGAWQRASIGDVASCFAEATVEMTASASLDTATHPPGTFLKVNSGSAVTVTVPQDSVYEFPVLHEIPIIRYGSGQITIAAGSGCTVRFAGSRDNINGQYGIGTLKKIAANEWVFTGDTSTS